MDLIRFLIPNYIDQIIIVSSVQTPDLYCIYCLRHSKFVFWWSKHPWLTPFNSYNKSLKVLLPAKHTLSTIKIHLKVPLRITLASQTAIIRWTAQNQGSARITGRSKCNLYLLESLNTFKKASLDINKSQFGKFFLVYIYLFGLNWLLLYITT